MPATANGVTVDFRALIAQQSVRRRRWQELREGLIERFLLLNGVLAVVLIALIFVFLFKEGVQALESIPLHRLIGSEVRSFLSGTMEFRMIWQPVSTDPKYSIVPLVVGSLMIAIPGTLIATIFGIGIGIYLSEVASERVREVAKPVIELLAGIPTVVLGFFCLAVLATVLQQIYDTTYRLNALLGGLGVSLVIIPVIASLTEDALRMVPDDIRAASYALGANRWETIWRALLPAAISGVSGSVILGIGRALGETMIVLMAAGNAALVTANIFSPVRTMTATIAAELGAVDHGSPHYYALFLVGSLLFTITFFVNLTAEVVINRARRKLKL
ncbi:MAG TPA: phosphate ABC transporter permease subunit PstC [Acidobacteriota bacterium]